MKKWTWTLALAMVLGVTFGAARGAWAMPSADPLPEFKVPASAKFNLTGNLSISSSGLGTTDSPITGSGAFSGDNYQLDLTARAQGGLTGETEVTSSQRLVDGKLYTKTSGPGLEEKWYVTDAGLAASNPYGGLGSLIGLNPELEEFSTVDKMGGKSEVDGVATTRYRIRVDLKALAGSGGGGEDIFENSEFGLDMWIGEADMYIHRVDYVLILASADSESAITIEYDMTFYDFDVPVSIVAPPNAEPLDIGSPPIMGGMPGSTTGVVSGMPGMTSAGMPTTGAPLGAGDNSLPLALLALGMGLAVSGLALRRVAHARQRAN